MKLVWRPQAQAEFVAIVQRITTESPRGLRASGRKSYIPSAF
jgi:hypothetical protein